ncbi:hypothetical protein Dimus_026920 [Dionaea muscipula]
MQKIDSHIKNMGKMSKASKLAIQLVQAKSVKPETSAHLFTILEAVMSSPTCCHQPSVMCIYSLLLFVMSCHTTINSSIGDNVMDSWCHFIFLRYWVYSMIELQNSII